MIMLKNPKDKEEWERFDPSGSSSNASLAVSWDGTFVSLGHSHACHGAFQANYGGLAARLNKDLEDTSQIDCIYSRRMKLLTGAEDLEVPYYTWLLNESPWAEAFLEKEYEKLPVKTFVLRADLPACYIASAAVATRYLTECYTGYNEWPKNRFALHKALLKGGVDPLWAFIVANMYRPADLKAKTFTFTMQSGHHVLPPELKMKSLKKFVTGDYNKEDKTFSEQRGYRFIDRNWVSDSDGTLISTLAKTWSFKKSGAVDYNVFRKPVGSSGYPTHTFEELLQVVDLLKGIVSDK